MCFTLECQLLASFHRKQVGAPEGLAQSEFIGVCRIWSMSNLEHSCLFRSYLLYPNSELSAVSFVAFLTH